MKISHWCVIAGMIMVVYGLKWGMKYQFLWTLTYTKICYNQLTDNALEDGLREGVSVDDSGEMVVDEDAAVKGFQESLLRAFDISGETAEGQHLLRCVACVVVMHKDSFTVITEEGKQSCEYDCEGTELTSSVISRQIEEKMQEVLEKQQPKKKYLIDFPAVRDEYCHTLEGVGMLCFMQYGDYKVDGMNYNRYVLSGARVVPQ